MKTKLFLGKRYYILPMVEDEQGRTTCSGCTFYLRHVVERRRAQEVGMRPPDRLDFRCPHDSPGGKHLGCCDRGTTVNDWWIECRPEALAFYMRIKLAPEILTDRRPLGSTDPMQDIDPPQYMLDDVADA